MGEAPGRTGEPNSSAPDTAYAVQAAIFRLAPVPHARSTLLIPPGDLLVVHWPSLPPPTLGERRHRFLARRRVAVGRRAVLVVDESERPQPNHHYQRVAVGRGLGGGARTDHTTCAGTVLDDELLAERKREFLRNHSAHRVHTAAWRVRHNQCDGTRRICLRVCRERPRGRRAEQRDELAPL